MFSAEDQSSRTVTGSRHDTPYQFVENRFSTYYRRVFNKKIVVDIGIMHQLWKEKPGIAGFHTSYNLMLDIILNDVF